MGQFTRDSGKMDFAMVQASKNNLLVSFIKGNGKKVRNQVMAKFTIKVSCNFKGSFLKE